MSKTDEPSTRTYPIIDHVPESELLAITQAGAERWLTSHGWTRESSLFVSPSLLVTVPGPKDTGRIANVIGIAARLHRMSPRKVIAEMQADSRIVEALRERRSGGAG